MGVRVDPPGMTSLPVASWTASAGPGLEVDADLGHAPVVARAQIGEPLARGIDQRSAANQHVTGPFSLRWVSCPEPPSPPRKLGMGSADVDADEVPVDHHLLAGHEQVAHPPIGTEHESVDRVGKVCEVVGGPYGDVGGSAHLQAAEVRAPEAGRSTGGARSRGLRMATGASGRPARWRAK